MPRDRSLSLPRGAKQAKLVGTVTGAVMKAESFNVVESIKESIW
jgi:hypothetical protein